MRIGRWIAAGAGLLLLAMLAGAVPGRPAAGPGDDHRVAIMVTASPVHTEIIVPVAAAGHDWGPIVGPFPDGRPATERLGFSWGDRAFFLATPSWADVDWRLALRALVASDASLVRVERIDGPVRGVALSLDAAQYRRLVAFLLAEIEPDGERLPGYFGHDRFLAGTGRYSGVRTCNVWAADGLRAAGVPVGRWTPLAPALMLPLRARHGQTVQ